MFDVPLFPVLVATVAVMTLGFIWYSPKVFGTLWMKESGVSSRTGGDEPMGKLIAMGALQNFLIVFLLAHFLTLGDREGGVTTASLTVWIALLIAASHLGSVIWERRSFSYYAITVGYLALSILLASAIVLNWPWA
jgi:hypothetical protein